jgi:hypothetical protein
MFQALRTKKRVRRAGEMLLLSRDDNMQARRRKQFPKDQKPEDGIQSGSVFRLLIKQSRSLTIEY